MSKLPKPGDTQKCECKNCGSVYWCNLSEFKRGRATCSGSCGAQLRDPRPLRERFNEKIEFEPMSGCWLWNAGTTADGYGKFWMNGKTRVAHRVSWEFHHQQIPKQLFVLHRCDTPPCVNPAHLFLGTKADNVSDMWRKGRARSVHGTFCNFSKLTDSDISIIRKRRQSGELHRSLATAFGCTQSNISQIVNKITWRHIP